LLPSSLSTSVATIQSRLYGTCRYLGFPLSHFKYLSQYTKLHEPTSQMLLTVWHFREDQKANSIATYRHLKKPVLTFGLPTLHALGLAPCVSTISDISSSLPLYSVDVQVTLFRSSRDSSVFIFQGWRSGKFMYSWGKGYFAR
jgi:hypothetical protein